MAVQCFVQTLFSELLTFGSIILPRPLQEIQYLPYFTVEETVTCPGFNK